MKNFLPWVVLAILFLALQEALFRAIFPFPEVENFNRVNYSGRPTEEKTASFFGNRAPAMNATFRWNSAPDGASFLTHLNLYGFRDRDWRVQGNHHKQRVMLIGDSVVEGMMATDDETISRGYARSAQARHEAVEAMNLGVGGTGIPNYLELLRDAVPLFRPQKIVLVIYANDLPCTSPLLADPGPPLIPKFTNPLTPRSLLVVRRALRRQVVPRRWHSPATLFLPVVPDPLNQWSRPPPEFSQVDPSLAEAMRKGEFNPFVVDLLNQAEKALRQPIDFTTPLRQFQQLAQNSNAELRIVYLPFSTQVSDYYISFQEKYALQKGIRSLMGPEYQIHSQAMANSCHQLGVPFLDLTPLLRKAEAGPEHLSEHLYWNYDEHMRGSAYLRVGATIEQWVHSTAEIENLASLN